MELSVQIGADINDLENAIDDIKKELKDFEKQAEKTAGSLQGSKNPFKKAAKDFDELKKSTSKNIDPLKKVGDSAKKSSVDFDKVSDAALDVVQKFTGVKGVSSDTANAVKGLASGLGVAGIAGVIAGVLLPVVINYISGLFEAKSITEQLDEATKKLTGSAISEISTLKSLVSVANDENQTKEQRLRAVRKIEDLYGSYIPNLSLEAIGTKRVAQAINDVTEGLIRQAKIRGVQDIISKKATEIAELTAEITEKTSKSLKESLKLSGTNLKTQDPRELLALGVNVDEVNEKVNKIRNNLKKGIIASQVSKETQDLQIELEQLQAQLQNLISEDFDLNGIFGGEKVTIRPKVKAISTIEAQNAIKPITTAIKKVKNANGDTIKIRVNIEDENALSANVENLLRPFTDGEFDIIKRKFNEAQIATEIFANAASNVLNTFANQLTQSLGISNKLVESFVGSIISSLADLLSAMIANAVKTIAINQATSTANAISAGTQSATATGPAAAFTIAPFIALAVGAVIAAFASVGSFNTGGFVGDKNLVRMNGDELIINSLQQSRLFNMLNTNVPRSSLNGANISQDDLNIVINSKVRGNNLLLSVARTQRKNNRFSIGG